MLALVLAWASALQYAAGHVPVAGAARGTADRGLVPSGFPRVAAALTTERPALDGAEESLGQVGHILPGLPQAVIAHAFVPYVLTVALHDGNTSAVAPEIHPGLGLPCRILDPHQALSGDTQALVAFNARAENQQDVTLDAPHFENRRVEAHST